MIFGLGMRLRVPRHLGIDEQVTFILQTLLNGIDASIKTQCEMGMHRIRQERDHKVVEAELATDLVGLMLVGYSLAGCRGTSLSLRLSVTLLAFALDYTLELATINLFCVLRDALTVLEGEFAAGRGNCEWAGRSFSCRSLVLLRRHLRRIGADARREQQ